MVTAMRVAGNKEGEGSKGIAMVTRVAGEQAASATMWAMAMMMREVGKEEGNSKAKAMAMAKKRVMARRMAIGLFIL
jgi:hypothetical protein